MTLPTVLPVLRTPRLVLRALVPSDADAVFALFSHPEVMRYWSWAPWTDPDEAARFIEQDREALAAGTWLRWGWVRAADDSLIGACGLFDLDADIVHADRLTAAQLAEMIKPDRAPPASPGQLIRLNWS